MPPSHHRVSSLKTLVQLQTHLRSLKIEIPCDEQLISGHHAPLARPIDLLGRTIGNRFCILPMEGWDSTADGCPSELTTRRWVRFGASGAKLIWGEAVAVRADGRDSSGAMVLAEHTWAAFGELRNQTENEHRRHFGQTNDLLIGLQLTHSGRFSRPRPTPAGPIILYHHPILDRKFGIRPDLPVMSDDEIAQLVDDFVKAARLAQRAGFAFVDLKHCHGYLGHEFLSAVDRPGKYGGSFENRTRFLRETVAGIRAVVPGLGIAVRLGALDWVPFRQGADGVGEPEPYKGDRYPYAFGGDGTGTGTDLAEPCAFLELLRRLDIRLVCISVGSPYYNPHIQRPALFPPCDGYQPPEDPLVGVARQIAVTAQLKHHAPDLVFVGSGYSYLQEWLPHVGQAVVRSGMADLIGLGRMALSYPELAADVLAGRTVDRRRICRTFSDCTTAPRNGLVSGCYPLDEAYKKSAAAEELKQIKRRLH